MRRLKRVYEAVGYYYNAGVGPYTPIKVKTITIRPPFRDPK